VSWRPLVLIDLDDVRASGAGMALAEPARAEPCVAPVSTAARDGLLAALVVPP